MQEYRQHHWDVSRSDRRFSPSWVYNQVCGGRDTGTTFPAVLKVLADTGSIDVASFPYRAGDVTSTPSSTQYEAAKPYRISSYSYLWYRSGGNDINALKAQIASGNPVVLGIPVYDNFYNCRGSWVGMPAGGSSRGNHAICAVGYDDSAGGGAGGVKIANSWGAAWGAGGYTYLSYSFISSYCWEAWVMTDSASDTPTIDSLSPSSTHVGADVTINGNNFGSNRASSAVLFNGSPATVTGWNNQSITVKVPWTKDGPVTVVNWAGERGGNAPFHLTLSIDYVDPAVGQFGKPVHIKGAGFGRTTGTVMLDKTRLAVTSWSDSMITYTAPARMCSGNLTVTAGGVTSNEYPFSAADSAWYLTEGATAGGIETWVLVQNPNSAPAHVDITYMTANGDVNGPVATLAPGTRMTFNVGDTVPGQWQVSTRVIADQPVVVERACYGNDHSWGTDSIGVKSPATAWYLAEGATAGGMETWILVQNPNASPASVSLTYMTPAGQQPGPSVSVPGGSRRSFSVGDNLPGAWEVSTRVTADKPVIAERAMYGKNRSWGTDSIGTSSPAATWYIPEGATSGAFETWILVQNPSGRTAHATLTYMTDKGNVGGPAADIPPRSRRSFRVSDTVRTYNVSTRVTADCPVVAERAVYVGGADATDSIGTSSLDTTWNLPEGSTAGGMETWVLIENPNDAATSVSVTYMTQSGAKQGPTLNLKPRSRVSIFASDTVPDQWGVSTRVTATGPVAVERACYGSNRRWATGSIGAAR
ncbi:MAG TPA: DUF5719 family protein [Candidatus Anoxymicrobiaceae bacterium]